MILDPLLGLFFALPHMAFFSHREGRWSTPRRRRRGLAIILGGIEGPSLAQHMMAAGLLRGRFCGAVENFEWNRGIPLVRCAMNLMNVDHQARQAARLAERIRGYQENHPDRPVHIVAISGGAAIVMRALSRIGTGPVCHVALIAPALSRDIDLSSAQTHCRHITLIESRLDCVLLGLGTTLLGSSDRRFGPAAGWLGLRKPTKNVRELVWRPEWVRFGSLGSHCTSGAPRFVQEVLLPLLGDA